LWTAEKLFTGEFDGQIATQTQGGQQKAPSALEGPPQDQLIASGNSYDTHSADRE